VVLPLARRPNSLFISLDYSPFATGLFRFIWVNINPMTLFLFLSLYRGDEPYIERKPLMPNKKHRPLPQNQNSRYSKEKKSARPFTITNGGFLYQQEDPMYRCLDVASRREKMNGYFIAYRRKSGGSKQFFENI
jgi:hypothetical protein